MVSFTFPWKRERSLDSSSTPSSVPSSELKNSNQGIDEIEQENIRAKYRAVPRAEQPSEFELASRWLVSKRTEWVRDHASYDFLDWFAMVLPCVGWLRRYKWLSDALLKDLVAGISISAMLVPHGLSYAKQNGGLPAQYGLYNSLVMVLIYFGFGSCRTLSVGPIAIVYALVKSGLQDVNPVYNRIKDNNKPVGAAQIAAQNDFNDMCLQVTFLVGIIQLIAWVLRLSFLLKFLSRSIMSGFTTAVAVIFTLSQLKSILGYATTPSNRVYLQIYYIFKNIGNFQWKEFVMGVSMLILLFTLHYLSFRFPRKLKYVRVFGPLIAMVLAIVISATARLDKHGIKIVGSIPRGLPPVSIDRLFPMKNFSKLLSTAFVAAAVSLLDANAIGKVVAAKNNYRLDSQREFQSIGLANLIGSFFTCTTTSGNFSRTAVWTQIGGISQLGGVVSAVLVGLCLLVATKAFQYIPNNTLAAITIYGLSGLFQGGHAVYLWKVSKSEFVVWNAAFWVAAMHSIEIGLATSIGASVIFYVLRTMFASLRQEGEFSDSSGNTVYRNVTHYTGAEKHSGICIFRLDTNIFFASVEDLHDHIMDIIDAKQKSGIRVSYAILDLASSPYIDPTGLHFLNDIIQNLKRRDVEFLLANPQESFMRALQRSGLKDKIQSTLFVSVADAFNFASDVIGYQKDPAAFKL